MYLAGRNMLFVALGFAHFQSIILAYQKPTYTRAQYT
jgi:hypothetical protein